MSNTFERGSPNRILPDEILELRSQPVVLPERSSWQIPQRVIDLVNECLFGAYPREFGIIIKPLGEEDVLVCPNSSLRRYRRQEYYQELHELSLEFFFQQFGDIPMWWGDVPIVDGRLPEKPILFPESQVIFGDKPLLKMTAEAKKATEETILVALLTHENLHRVPRVVIKPEYACSISPDDPLFSLVFTPRTKRRDSTLLKYAREHNPAILLEGARIIVFCDEENGSRKIIAQSGAELNETITELLALRAVNLLLEYLEKTYSEDLVVFVKQRLSAYELPQQEILKVKLYLERLGLETPSSLLRAYTNMEIPHLHIKHLPNEEYFP